MSTKRQYDSSLRKTQAAETRKRIQLAARKLFASNGFVETTVGQIAAESGVSSQTIYATFGSKAAIVTSMLEHLEQEAGLPDTVAAITAETDPRAQLRIFVGWIRHLFETSADIFSSVLQAPGVPELAAIRENGDSNRLEGCRLLAQSWEAAGLANSASVAEQIWLLTSIENYFNCVERLGWTTDQYEEWVRSSLEKLLFD